MNENKAYCSICGADITRSMKFHDNMANRYCYDCYQAMKARSKRPAVKKPKGTRKISCRKAKKLYKDGYKPSEIASMLNCTAEEVYEALRK